MAKGIGRQFVRRFGVKQTRPGRVVRTGRVFGANPTKRQERQSRPLRPKMKPRTSR